MWRIATSPLPGPRNHSVIAESGKRKDSLRWRRQSERGARRGRKPPSRRAKRREAGRRSIGFSAGAGSSVATELRAGIATFLTMACIMFVNPAILERAGMDHGAVFVATCLAAAISSIIMGVYANYPIALAPGMGLNAYFAFTMVPELGGNWQLALALVFLSGAVPVDLAHTLTRMADQRHSHDPEARHRRRHRPVPGATRAHQYLQVVSLYR